LQNKKEKHLDLREGFFSPCTTKPKFETSNNEIIVVDFPNVPLLLFIAKEIQVYPNECPLTPFNNFCGRY